MIHLRRLHQVRTRNPGRRNNNALAPVRLRRCAQLGAAGRARISGHRKSALTDTHTHVSALFGGGQVTAYPSPHISSIVLRRLPIEPHRVRMNEVDTTMMMSPVGLMIPTTQPKHSEST